MPKVIRPPFLPHSLRKLREISGATIEEAAKRVGKDEDTIRRWESDDNPELPTYGQGTKLGGLYGYPIVLALGEIPAHLRPPELPDFRTAEKGGRATIDFSRNLRRLIDEVLFRQEFVLEHAPYWELPHQNWVGSAETMSTEPENLGRSIRSQTGISVAEQASFAGNREAMQAWTRAVGQRIGVFVCQASNQRGSQIEVREMRGLSLAHAVAPFAVVNSRDSQAGRIFTLFHEIAHLWVGKGGISGYAGLSARAQNDRNDLEAYCDETAASALMPRNEFRDAWNEVRPASTFERLNAISDRFNVSREAVAVRAAKRDLMSWDEYRSFRETGSFDRPVARPRGAPGGGNFYRTHLRNIGEKYARLVLGSWIEGQLELREAADYMGVKPGTFLDFARFLGARV